jgi:hypothetical protein
MGWEAAGREQEGRRMLWETQQVCKKANRLWFAFKGPLFATAC